MNNYLQMYSGIELKKPSELFTNFRNWSVFLFRVLK
jgi:hypothetical protein